MYEAGSFSGAIAFVSHFFLKGQERVVKYDLEILESICSDVAVATTGEVSLHSSRIEALIQSLEG